MRLLPVLLQLGRLAHRLLDHGLRLRRQQARQAPLAVVLVVVGVDVPVSTPGLTLAPSLGLRERERADE